jgi:hypothetical protein
LNPNQESVVVNFAGEGELPGAINVNTLENSLRKVEHIIGRGPLIKADIRGAPLVSGRAEKVYGRNLPFLSSDEWAGQVSREAFRVLKRHGTVQFCSETGGARGSVPWLTSAGFANVRVENGYAVGDKV